MICPDCGRVLTEHIDKDEDELYLECKICGFMTSLDDSVYQLVEFQDMEELDTFLLYHDDIDIVEVTSATSECMSDYLHKCLRCNQYAFEVKENSFKCMKCGFSWEVYKSE